MADPASVRHFGRHGVGYRGFRNAWPLGNLRRAELRALHALAPVRAGERVLDAGCGDGEVMHWLTVIGAVPTGIDAVRSMAVACRRRGLRVAVQDIEQLGLQPRFDWVFCIGVIEFTLDPGRALHSLAGCLHHEGRLVLLFPRRGLLDWLYATYHRAHGIRAHLFTRGEMAALLRAAGFDEPRAWRDCLLSTLCVATLRR